MITASSLTRFRFALFATSCGLALLAACSSDSPTPANAVGAEGQACFANGTCNSGLACETNVCVFVGDAASTSDAQSEGDGGTALGDGGSLVDSGTTQDTDSGNDADTDAATCGSACVSVTATVHDVDTGVIAVNQAVTINTAFVTARNAAGTKIWIADSLTSSTSSGIAVVSPTAVNILITVGATVKVAGAFATSSQQMLGLGATPGVANSPEVTLTAAATFGPTPATVTTATVASGASIAPWVGSLVTVSNLKVTAVTGTGSTKQISLSNGASTVVLGTELFDPNASVGTCYGSIVGIASLDASANALLLPRTLTDLTQGGSCN